MFNVIYRWKIRPGKEAQFEAAWAEITRFIRQERGGLGSRLHRSEDGTYLAYAEWPDEATWARSSASPLPAMPAVVAFREAIESSEKPLPLTQLQDLLAR